MNTFKGDNDKPEAYSHVLRRRRENHHSNVKLA
jgi:hypothetical protein